jgi:hypothetical protein
VGLQDSIALPQEDRPYDAEGGVLVFNEKHRFGRAAFRLLGTAFPDLLVQFGRGR